MEEAKKIIYVSGETHGKLKLIASKRKITMEALAEEALAALITKENAWLKMVESN